jgi:hypothetical protein
MRIPRTPRTLALALAGAAAAWARTPHGAAPAAGARARPPAPRCDTLAPGPSVPPAALRAALRRVPPQPPGAARSYHAELADIAREVPGGFAGYFLDPPAYPPGWDPSRADTPAQQAVVRLVRPADRAAALAALVPRLARYHGGTVDLGAARVLPARWDLAQLDDWSRYIGASVGGAIRVRVGGIDEVRNRIFLGVGTEPERQALRRRLAALGAPCGLVEVALVRVGLP